MAEEDEAALFYAAKERRSAAAAPWTRTLAIQAALCLAFYTAFHIGTPQPQCRRPVADGDRIRRDPTDLYFISVRGGFGRASDEQARLLRQMKRTAKALEVKFVINIAELGEDDQLRQNASFYFPSEIPWYSTTVSRGQPIGMFWKKFHLPLEKVLEILLIDTGPLQDIVHDEQLEGIQANRSSQLNWINEALSVADGDWRIVAGLDPLIVCEATETTEIIKFNEPLHQMFMQHRVDAYLSEQGCAGYFHHRKSVAYIQNPGRADELSRGLLMNANAAGIRQIDSGFLLHRINSLQMESNFIDSEGNMVFQTVIHREGREREAI